MNIRFVPAFVLAALPFVAEAGIAQTRALHAQPGHEARLSTEMSRASAEGEVFVSFQDI